MHLINLSDLSKSFNDVEMQLYSCREIIKECNQFLNLINIEEKDRRTETFDTLVKQYDEKAELQEDIKDKIECYKEKIQCYDKEIALNKDIKRIKDLYKQKIDSLKKIADLTENEEIKIECYEGQINCYDKEIALNEDIKSTRYIKYLYEQKVGTLQKIANLTENEEIKKQCQDRILECCKQVLDKEPDDIKFLKKKTEIQKAKTPVKNMSAPISFNGNEIRGLDESSLTILGHESKNEVLELGAKLREHSTSSPSKKPSFNDNLPKQDKSPTGGRGFN